MRFGLLILSITVAIAGGTSSVASEVRLLADERSLGKTLFHSSSLSADQSVSCASCHSAFQAFARPMGERLGARDAPSLLDVAARKHFFWDGRRDFLDALVVDPLLNPTEHGMGSTAAVVQAVVRDKGLAQQVADLYRIEVEQIEIGHVTRPLAAFVGSLRSDDSSFDRYQQGEFGALSPQAVEGFKLFVGEAACSSCHLVGAPRAMLTDDKFHSQTGGLGASRVRLVDSIEQVVRLQGDRRALDNAILTNPAIASLGRFVVTLDPADIGKFRTPSLRNVEVTAPYMHDGGVATLEQAVEREVYYRSERVPGVRPLGAVEKAALVAFLKALTSADQVPK